MIFFADSKFNAHIAQWVKEDQDILVLDGTGNQDLLVNAALAFIAGNKPPEDTHTVAPASKEGKLALVTSSLQSGKQASSNLCHVM